jgi:endonuclease G
MRTTIGIILFILCQGIHAQKVETNGKQPFSTNQLEIPALKPGETIIKHTGYSLTYNELYEQANWVAYELTEMETIGKYERTNKFLTDPMVTTGTADHPDYLKSNFDRGHLAPAGDMGWSAKSMAESFYYSNMSPQVPTFNRGIWEDAEELMRAWAKEYKSIYIVTGPILEKGLKTIGPNKVAVPKYYYKVILDYKSPKHKGIGLILPNGDHDKPLKDYFITIDSVEKRTGIDFFPVLPDSEENRLESEIVLRDWVWNSNPDNMARKSNSIGTTSNSNATKSSNAVYQCIGTTQKGKRCKRMTSSPSGKCPSHQ